MYFQIFLRYLRLCEVFNWSGKCPLWDISSQGNICRAFVWSGKCPSGMCLVGEMTVGHSSGRGCAWSGKCPSGMCLVGEVSVGDVSGRGNVCRGSVRRGRVRRGNVRRGCVRESETHLEAGNNVEHLTLCTKSLNMMGNFSF